MQTLYYYVFCEGVLGVKTNVKNFKWIYGSLAPMISLDEYAKCVIKFEVIIKSEKDLETSIAYNQQFQSYKWVNLNKTLSCRRSFFKKLNIGYDIRIDGNTVYAEIGEHYFKYIKNRVMNLHGTYYLLSDLANIMLMKEGYLTLYASSVYNNNNQRCVINFAPPNTGKTLTAVKLCETNKYSLVGEDVVIIKDNIVYSCPWTNSYRKNKKGNMDNSGSLNRNNSKNEFSLKKESKITDCIVLSLGECEVNRNSKQILKKSQILSEYLFNGYSSPIVNLLGYFDDAFSENWKEYSNNMMKNLINKCNVYFVQSPQSDDFYSIVDKIIEGTDV